MDQNRLLIIDEDRSSRDALQFVFISRGWEVAMAASEDQGISLLHDYEPDWVIIAWQQLSGTGMRFLQAVRPTGRSTRLLVLTDGLTATERAMLKRLRADMVFAKPVIPDVIFRSCATGTPALVSAG
jgi:DNA-binding response OmpR family regulator